MVKDTMKYREDNNLQRKDFLQLLIELRKQDIQNPKSDDDRKLVSNNISATCPYLNFTIMSVTSEELNILRLKILFPHYT